MKSFLHYFRFAPLFVILSVVVLLIGYSYTPQYQRHIANQIADQSHSLLLSKQQNALYNASKMITYSTAGLESILKEVPSAARDSVQIIQTNLEAIPPISRFSTVAFVTRPGHSPTVVANALPIFQWRDFLPNIIDNKCTYIDASKLTDPDAKARVSSFAFGTIACPIVTPTNDVIGIIGVSFDKAEDVPCQHDCPAGVQTMDQVLKIDLDKAREFGKYFSDLSE
jgi:hypothetical protein